MADGPTVRIENTNHAMTNMAICILKYISTGIACIAHVQCYFMTDVL